MNSFKAIKQVNQIENLLNAAGLGDLVSVTVESALNNRDKKVPHVVARWTTTDLGVNEAKTAFAYNKATAERFEELNNYFCPKVFALGITQRADFIKATHDQRTEALKARIHPAQFKLLTTKC